jgi:hypothetical protein
LEPQEDPSSPEDEGELYPGLEDKAADADASADDEVDGMVGFHEIPWGEVDADTDKDSVKANEVPWASSATGGTPKLVASQFETVLSVMMVLLDMTALQQIVDETNAYEADCERFSWYSAPRLWVELTVGELLRWLGLCLGMALQRHAGPTSLYWTGKKVGCMQYPNFNEFMPQARWEQIKRFLHLKSNKDRPPNTCREGRCWQFLWLEQALNTTAKAAWNVARCLCLDERGFPSRHQLCPIRVYNPSKPHKFHICQQALVDSSGFIWHTWVYDRIKKTGLKLWVCTMMLGSLPCRGFKIYFDRWYGSPNLSQVCSQVL